MEKVTVVMTTYNLEKYIADALNSVLMQKTDFCFKILVGDDASTDKTPEILKQYQNKYPDIIEVRFSKTNSGSLKNSNRLFDGLKSEYFSFLDGDDIWIDENRLQKQVDFLDSHREYMMCAGNTQYIKNGEKADFLLKSDELGKTYTFDDFINHKMPFFHVSSILLRNTIYVNGLPECYRAAEDTFENCALRGEDFRRISHLEQGPLFAMPDLFSYYRIHEGGLWQGASEAKRRIEGAISYNFYRKYYKNTEYFQSLNEDFSSFYSSLMEYLVNNLHFANTFSLPQKETELLCGLLKDLSVQKINFNSTETFVLSKNINEKNKSRNFAAKIKNKLYKLLGGGTLI